MSIVVSSHDCLDHCEPRIFDQLFKCQGCKMDGFGQGHQCNLCHDTLHNECRYPKATTTHEFFGGSTLTFLDKPFIKRSNCKAYYRKICDACGKDISGFSYHCEEDNLDVHPCCLNLQKMVRINGDTVFNLKAKVVSKCMWCKKKKISDDKKRGVLGWSYISECNKHHIHVYCMTEMMRDAFIMNGDKGLDKVDLRTVAKRGRNGATSTSKTFEMIKSLIKVILSALLGDPTLLISSVLVELISRGLQ